MMNEGYMPTLYEGDMLLLKNGEMVTLLSTDYVHLIVRYQDQHVAMVSIREYVGLISAANRPTLQDTQEMEAIRQ